MISLLNGLIKFLGTNNWLSDLVDDLKPILMVLFSAVAAAGIAYAVYLGFLLAKAEDQGKRKEAKSRIYKTLLGILIIAVLLATTFVDTSFLTNLESNNRDQDKEWYVIMGGNLYNDKNKLITFSSGNGPKVGNWRISELNSGNGPTINLWHRPRLDNGEFGPGVGWGSTDHAVRITILTQSPADGKCSHASTSTPPCSGRRESCMGAEITNSGNFRVDSVTNNHGQTINTLRLGATGKNFSCQRAGVITISIEYFDLQTSSFQLAVPSLGFKVLKT